MAKTGQVDEHVMYNTFNMGIGMCLAVAPEDVERTLAAIRSTGDAGYVIGSVTAGDKTVTLH